MSDNGSDNLALFVKYLLIFLLHHQQQQRQQKLHFSKKAQKQFRTLSPEITRTHIGFSLAVVNQIYYDYETNLASMTKF